MEQGNKKNRVQRQQLEIVASFEYLRNFITIAIIKNRGIKQEVARCVAKFTSICYALNVTIFGNKKIDKKGKLRALPRAKLKVEKTEQNTKDRT